MKKLMLILIFVISFCVMSALPARAQSDTQTITFEVQAVDALSVSGNPASLTVSGTLDPVTDNSTTYDVSTNGTGKKVTGQITTDGDMPANTTLEVNLAAPTGGSSAGDVTLVSASAGDLVTGIETLDESGLTITYTFTATADAGVIASDTRVVTLTITDS